MSIQWGAWAGAGMAAANAALLDKLQRQGYGAVQPTSGLLALQSILCQGHVADLSVVMVSPFQWGTFLTGTRSTQHAHLRI